MTAESPDEVAESPADELPGLGAIDREAHRKDPGTFEDVPPSPHDADRHHMEVIGIVRSLIREGEIFFRVVHRYDARFSIRTGQPFLFWLLLSFAMILDLTYFFALVALMLAAIFLVIYTLAKGVGLV